MMTTSTGARALAFLVLVSAVLAPRAVMAAPAENLTVVITTPAEDSVVSGRVAVAAEASEGTIQVDFSVSTDGGITSTPIGSDNTSADGWTASWSSEGYSGAALITATATDGTLQATDEVGVRADNAPPRVSVGVSRRAFSPNGDGRKDAVVLTASSNEPTDLTLQIVDREGRVRRRWVSDKATTSFEVPWNGRAARQALRDGRYIVRATGVDRVGLPGRGSRPVVIDTAGPRIRSLRIGPKLFVRSGTLTARYRLRDRSARFSVRLQIRDRLGPTARATRVSGNNSEVRFATRYSDGTVLYPGRYSARLIVEDDAGNVTRSRNIDWRMHRPVDARNFKRLKDAGRRVALTIDDCNDPGAWARMLDILQSFRTKATFFCSGQMVARYPELARRTVADGHAIGSHGWDHQYMMGKPQAETEWRIRADARVWWDLTRETTAAFYRPAFGYHDRDGMRAASATGHGRVIMWDVDSIDYGTSSPSLISNRVIRESRPGSIVLLHVLDRTADALPSILRGLAQRDLQPVDLYRLFRAGGYR